jgi:hypothetical protein
VSELQHSKKIQKMKCSATIFGCIGTKGLKVMLMLQLYM